MTRADRSGWPGRGFILAGVVVGIVVSLGVGLLVAAVLNSVLENYWVRGIATLAAGILVAGLMLREVVLTARSRLRAVEQHEGAHHAGERP
jgi:uncharacterized membrane protein